MTCSTDTGSHVTRSSDVDSCVSCSKKIRPFINCMQLQGFPIDSIHLHELDICIIEHFMTSHLYVVTHDLCWVFANVLQRSGGPCKCVQYHCFLQTHVPHAH